MNRTERSRQKAYHEFYRAVCELSSSLFDQAMEVCGSEQEAAALATCSLVSALSQNPSNPGGLLRRITELRWRRRRTARRPTRRSRPSARAF